jgi:alpha-methylacyl-CoA racemase
MGPLSGVKVIELAGIGPAPFCGMLLADLGADVLRIDRKAGGARSVNIDPTRDVLNRGRRSIAMDLKRPDAIEALLRLVEGSDIFVEGFRPGVTERMGVGPEACLARNAKLVYGRMTGWGQTGPLAQTAGHDINYLAFSGALHLIGRKGEKPVPPLNMAADMGGGGLFLAFGLVCALLEARTTGQGQVVDAAMTEGAALQLYTVLMMRANGHFSDERGTNLLDTGAPFYEVYETADGGYLAIGAIEPEFYALLCKGADLDPQIFGAQMDRSRWDEIKAELTRVFKNKTRSAWEEIFSGTDACVTPVLSLAEAASYPHNRARGTYLDTDVLQPPRALAVPPARCAGRRHGQASIPMKRWPLGASLPQTLPGCARQGRPVRRKIIK